MLVSLSFDPPDSATLGDPVTVRVQVSEPVTWVQVIVYSDPTGAADGAWSILDTLPPDQPFRWTTEGDEPGSHAVVVNVGLTDGTERFWVETATYLLTWTDEDRRRLLRDRANLLARLTALADRMARG